ncbi:MAG TPA: hypothetical protein PLL01_05530 [Rhodoferax sp.]|jgi:hypothetical protein|nr:hypothetical protein [Rhodoferax sp.]HPW28836.1 hypothetical protein [Rhodoferax sp.]
MRIRNSFWGAFARDGADSHDVALERVRSAMLRLVDEFGGKENSRLDRQISESRDIAELWHLRPDLMQLIAATQGEELASVRVAEITALFKKHHLGGAPRR